PWPRWDIDCRGGLNQLMLVDRKLNIIAFIIVNDDPSSWYKGSWTPETMDGYAVLHLDANRVIKIPKVENTLFLFSPDGTSSSCKLQPGNAASIGQTLVMVKANLRKEFEHWKSLSPP